MKFLHTADIHWGMTPDGDKPWCKERTQAIKDTFAQIIDLARTREVDFLFISGDRRDMLPHSRLMIHDPLIPRTGGSALHLKAISDDLMETRQITAKVIAEHSGRSLEEVLEKTAADSFFQAEEAVAFGLADNIIKSFDESKGGMDLV